MDIKSKNAICEAIAGNFADMGFAYYKSKKQMIRKNGEVDEVVTFSHYRSGGTVINALILSEEFKKWMIDEANDPGSPVNHIITALRTDNIFKPGPPYAVYNLNGNEIRNMIEKSISTNALKFFSLFASMDGLCEEYENGNILEHFDHHPEHLALYYLRMSRYDLAKRYINVCLRDDNVKMSYDDYTLVLREKGLPDSYYHNDYTGHYFGRNLATVAYKYNLQIEPH